MKGFIAVLLVPVMLVGACSTELNTKTIDQTLSASDGDAEAQEINGIPFRIHKRYLIKVYQKKDGKYGETPVFQKVETLANQEHLFVLGFSAGVFSNGSVDLTLNADNTLQTLTVKDASQLPKAIEELGEQTAAVDKAIATAKQTAEATEAAQSAAKATALTAQEASKIEAERARIEASDKEAIRILLQADPSATADQIRKATDAERLAKIVANEKARQAGFAPFYPDVVAGVIPPE